MPATTPATFATPALINGITAEGFAQLLEALGLGERVRGLWGRGRRAEVGRGARGAVERRVRRRHEERRVHEAVGAAAADLADARGTDAARGGGAHARASMGSKADVLLRGCGGARFDRPTRTRAW